MNVSVHIFSLILSGKGGLDTLKKRYGAYSQSACPAGISFCRIFVDKSLVDMLLVKFVE